MKFVLRNMVVKDISHVVDIERKSFPTPWSPYAFTCELSDNEFAHYLVVVPEIQKDRVVGYGGMWIIIDEAHITNVAIEPEFRGKQLGEMLMKGLMRLAKAKNALNMTLEVRISNSTAQNLYKKLGFVESGVRPGYYVDTNEDAIIMWKNLRDVPY